MSFAGLRILDDVKLGGCTVSIHAQPGAAKSEIVGLHGEALKVRLRAPAVDGKANDELVRFMAEFFGLKRAQVRIARGEKSRSKAIALAGLDATQARARLATVGDL
jgi:uncharacterized protein (TIGR00251 family)